MKSSLDTTNNPHAGQTPLALPPGPVVVDVAGTSLTEAEARRLRHPGVGGVILFARNFESRAQLTAL